MKKNSVIVAAGLGLAQLLLLTVAAHAQDTTRVLNPVVVTATRSPKKLSDISRDVTVITAKQMSESQGKTLPEILNTVPGITFSGATNAPGISNSIYLRGEPIGNILVLVDGFPVNNAAAIDNSYDLNAFPVDQIDHIEILKGSAATLYGSDAVAGVINIITKHPEARGLKSDVQFSGGSYNTFKEAAGLNGQVNNTGVALNVSNSDSRGFPGATDTTGKGGFKDDGFHQRAISLNLDQQVTKKFILNCNFQTTYNTGNLPYGAFEDDQNYTYQKTFMFGGLGAKWLLDKGTLNVNVSQNDVCYKYNDLANTVNYETPYNEKDIGRITDAEAIFAYNLNEYLDITSGADFKYSNTFQRGSYDTIHTVNNNVASIYTSLFFKAGIFHMEMGGRYNHDEKYGNNFSYTINPSLLLADQFKLFGTIASAYKAPTLYQLFSEYGNLDLKPETTTSYEAGFDWQVIKNLLSFNTEFYKYHTKAAIYFEDLANFPYGVYENGEVQNDKGFESELKLTANKLTASAYAAYVTGTLIDETGAISADLYRRPKNTYGVTIYYQFIDSFSAGLDYKYTGGKSDENFGTYPVSYVYLKPYNLVDAHLQYKPCKRVQLFADLNNILNVKYTDWYGYNTERLNFMAGVRYQIN
jgi:vitamin B12 transporter